MKIKKIIYLCLINLTIISCASKPKGIFTEEASIPAPDYSLMTHWAAHPDKNDLADITPKGLVNVQDTASIDVFYIHPTIYYGKRKYNQWNAPIYLQDINDDVDDVAIRYQASAFNGVGKVYAPRYRQAHIKAYGHKDQSSAKKAFDLAYMDVKASFEYYIKHFNGGRPFIIASHSQGTTHAQKIVKELIDGSPLHKQFIVGYLLGIPVSMQQYNHVSACKDSLDTGCLVGWRTFREGTTSPILDQEMTKDILITNPLTWNNSTDLVPREMHKGAVLTNFDDGPIPELVDAQIHKTILWINKPKFKGSFLIWTDNYHRGDINLFYMDIRYNAILRSKAYSDALK